MSEPAQTIATHQAWLRRLARRLVRSEAAAEDLVQETYETALRKLPPDEHMRPWLGSVMRNLAWHHVRGEYRRIAREESFRRETSCVSPPDALLDYGVDRERLVELVETLPQPFRATVVQRYLEGLSCAEIARAEGVPAGTVRWRQSRALELLREQLAGGARSGRRRLPVWLPFVWFGERIAVRAPTLLVSGRCQAMLLAAAAVLFVALALRGDNRGQVARGSGSASAIARGAATSQAAPGAEPRDPGEGGPLAQPRPVRGADLPVETLVSTRRISEASARRRRRDVLDRLREVYEVALYDCEVGRDDVLRCQRESLDPESAGGGTCQILVRSLDALWLARKRPTRSPHPGGFLAAAALANLSLVRRLGCTLIADLDGDRSADPSASGGDDRQDGLDGRRACHSHEGPDGEDCTTCTDESGVHTACSPVDCRSTTGPDGQLCTTCTDARGRVETNCALGWSPSDCTSVLQSYGLVCSTCAGDGGAPPECLAAECSVSNRCLECTDPKGRVATDCSIDYESLPTASSGIGGGDTFDVCSTSWGFPGGSSGVCHYPGADSCTVDAAAGCIDCTYPGGSGSGLCQSPDEPLPDIMAGRPSSLPPPGECASELGPDGAIVCSTCTRADLGASKMCRFPPAESCDVSGGDTPGEKCMVCRLTGGGTAAICDSAGS